MWAVSGLCSGLVACNPVREGVAGDELGDVVGEGGVGGAVGVGAAGDGVVDGVLCDALVARVLLLMVLRVRVNRSMVLLSVVLLRAVRVLSAMSWLLVLAVRGRSWLTGPCRQ